MEEKTPEQGTNGATIDSKFRLVLVAANRAEQLIRGARPKLEAGKRKPTRMAMEEVNANLVEWGYGPAPQPAAEPGAENESGGDSELVEQPAGEVH
jgi:DNA-directed RNA polymerase omega subunit